MRQKIQGDVLTVRAIAGSHVVTLAWDFLPGQRARKAGLLGFAVERSELKGDKVIERYFLRGIKRFKHKDEGLSPGTPVPTSEHPIQSFQWGDYTAKPATRYRYRIIPAYGKPKLVELDDASSTTVEITTEAEQGKHRMGVATHDIYFNRGVAGSQAYARKFPNAKPNEARPDSEQMKWLSRGLYEALTAFIGKASGPDFGLRGMFYEFRYLPVGKAFAEAAGLGADVDIRYEAQSYKDHNEEMIAKARIKRICKPQKVRSGIRHNKFIVLLHHTKPVAVFLGSTNISAGGIFGHSNVGHVVWDEKIAERYLSYWEELAAPDVTRGKLVDANLTLEPTPSGASAVPTNRVLTLFSPRDSKAEETLNWYADVMGSAKRIMCMTFAFTLDDLFQSVLLQDDKILRYALFDKSIGQEAADQIEERRNTVIAIGEKLKEGDFESFLGEDLTGFNKNLYIHDKFMLVDPLGSDPLVITGTANFSPASQKSNDENMLVIRGNARVADIYFGEFMRIFDHLYSRYIVRKLRESGRNDPDAGFLKDTPADWVTEHFKPGRKALRRKYFVEG